ncbi:alpha/beta hydrolase [Planctomycetota bacterium]
MYQLFYDKRKKPVFFVILIILFAGISELWAADDITGDWEFQIGDVGMEIAAGATFTKNEDGSYEGTWDQSFEGDGFAGMGLEMLWFSYTVSDIKFDDPNLTFVYETLIQTENFEEYSILSNFSGTMTGDKIEGTSSNELGISAVTGTLIQSDVPEAAPATSSQQITRQSSAAGSDIQPTLTIPIWPGVAPGSEDWTGEETETQLFGNVIVSNVSKPTLTVYLPEPSKATGTGVIVAPGGAFRFLSINMEGHDVARWLAERGIAAFVLKYRVVQSTGSGFDMGARGGTDASSGEQAGTTRIGAPAEAGTGESRGASLSTEASGMDESGKYGIADGIQAIKVVWEHADEWGIDPNRVGFVGFSAGAMVTAAALLQADPSTRPNFAAPIYGGPFGAMPEIPANMPPVFLAWAQDDILVGEMAMKFYEALKAAGNNPELHIFVSGGHGFGMQEKGTSSDHWIDMFYYWMEAHGWTKSEQ